MSTRTVALTPGRANKRFIMLAVVLGLVGAILVYAAFSRDSSSGGASSSAADTPVVVAKAEIPARTKITQAMVEVKLVPLDTRSALAFEDASLVVGKVTRFPIAVNEQVLSNKIVGLTPGAAAQSRSLSYTIPQGKRGFAIGISEVSSAGGLVLPGDYVDVLIIYNVDFRGETRENYLVQTIFQNVEVLAVSQAVVDVVPEASPSPNGQRVRNSEARPNPGAGTVTLSLTPEQSQRMYLAEANGRIRLAVRPYGEADERPVDYMTEIELFPTNLPNPFTR
ncbi:MAG TPA: Flp pilus assembly protein CpaB [Dehalococcoidia bacterium]|nr:Flp pilus assembly protein CpaB [Dehalococcoidia bacterium]